MGLNLRPSSGAPWPIGSVASHFGFEPSERALRDVSAWLDLLVTWNARHDLTAARSHDELVDLLLADAAFFAARLPHGARVVDVGTGAGAPGLALALLRPDLAVTLVEPLTKRVSFMRTTLAEVDRLDVTLLRERGEALVRSAEEPARWDVAMARATLPPEAWLELGGKLLAGRREAGEGTTWVLLAQKDPPTAAAARVLHDERYTWPRTGHERRAIAYAAP